MFYQIKCS